MKPRLAPTMLVALAWIGNLLPTQAAQSRWTNGGGDRLWANTNNWSALAVPTASTEILIDDQAASGPITANVNYARSSRITFSKPGGYTIVRSPSGSWQYLADATVIAVTVENQTMPYVIPRYYNSVAHLSVAAGSTLIQNANYGGPHHMLTGPGTFLYQTGTGVNDGSIRRLTIHNHGLFIYDNWNSYDYMIDTLAGTGTLACARGNLVIRAPADCHLEGFFGCIDVRTPPPGSTSRLLFKTSPSNTIHGLRVRLGTDTLLGRRVGVGEEVPGAAFANSVFEGKGRIEFNGPEGSYWYGTAYTNRLTACTVKPGLDGAGVLTFQCDPLFIKQGLAACQYLCEIVGTNGTAGTDYDQLAVIPSGGLSTYLGGYVFSASSASNPLADLDLVVDLSTLAAGTDCSASTLTVLTARNDFAGASFNSVTWLNGSGTVNYNNGNVTLTDVVAGVTPTGTLMILR